MLEGTTVNLRVREKEDLPMFMEWMNDPELVGEYQPFIQRDRVEMEKMLEGARVFVIEKKDKTEIGYVGYSQTGTYYEIGYALVPNERRKGPVLKPSRSLWITCFYQKKQVAFKPKLMCEI